MSIRIPRLSASAAIAARRRVERGAVVASVGHLATRVHRRRDVRDVARRNGRRATRAARGWLFAAGLAVPGMAWMWSLTIPGYLAAVAIFAGFHAVAAAVVAHRTVARDRPARRAHAGRGTAPRVPVRWRAARDPADRPGRRARWPDAVRVGGVILLTWVVFQIGFALSGPSPFVPQLARNRGRRNNGEWHGAIGLAAAIVVRARRRSPLRRPARMAARPSTLRVAIVQGGGPQGTRAINTDPREVVERHLAATRTIRAGEVDLVVWPENVIDVVSLAGSRELSRGGRRGSADRRAVRGRHHRGRARTITSSTPRWSSPPTARSCRATRRCIECPSASTCRSAACSRRSAPRPIWCPATPWPARARRTSTSPSAAWRSARRR